MFKKMETDSQGFWRYQQGVEAGCHQYGYLGFLCAMAPMIGRLCQTNNMVFEKIKTLFDTFTRIVGVIETSAIGNVQNIVQMQAISLKLK